MPNVCPKFLPLTTYDEVSAKEMARRAKSFRDEMLRRRTVRQFSSRAVPRKVIEDCLCVARNAPSGANKQPWHFVVVSNAEVKHKIRVAAEEEEHRFYHGRAPKEWLVVGYPAREACVPDISKKSSEETITFL